MVSSPNPKNVGEPVAETPVITGPKQLTVSTVLLDVASSSYSTTILDDSADRRHHGMGLGDGWVIGRSQQMGTREAALDLHREALYAARTEEPWPPNGGHDSDCAYVGGISSNCTCSTKGGAA
jgi:hypothetical protein